MNKKHQRNPCECLGLTTECGTIEVGKLADLVLLEANPLAEIANTRKISHVVVNGRLFDRGQLEELLQQTRWQ